MQWGERMIREELLRVEREQRRVILRRRRRKPLPRRERLARWVYRKIAGRKA